MHHVKSETNGFWHTQWKSSHLFPLTFMNLEDLQSMCFCVFIAELGHESPFLNKRQICSRGVAGFMSMVPATLNKTIRLVEG